MDPYAPINGISLERYAELSADCSDTQDPNQQAEIVAKKGVQRADWEAAKAGWTARMQDMSLMGQVATRFMPLYNAELAKKSGGAPTVSFEDYVAMSGTAKAIGYEGMLAHYKVTPAQWTQIGMHWNSKIPTNPQYMQFGLLVEQEGARIHAGGQPKPVTLGAPGAAPAAAAPGAPARRGVAVARSAAPSLVRGDNPSSLRRGDSRSQDIRSSRTRTRRRSSRVMETRSALLTSRTSSIAISARGSIRSATRSPDSAPPSRPASGCIRRDNACS